MPCVFYLLVSGMCDWSQVFGDLKFTARNYHTTGKTASLLYSLIQTQSNLILLNSFELNDNASPGIFFMKFRKILVTRNIYKSILKIIRKVGQFLVCQL